MDLDFNAADRAFRQEVRGLIGQVTTGEAGELTARWREALIARRWQAIKLPTEFGGAGWTPTQHFIWERETTQAGLPPQIGGMGMGMLAPILIGYGDAAQKARFLPDILADTVHWCQGYSEPGAGSDLASLRTRAALDGDHYVVDGEKVWTSGAHRADWMFCLTRTATEAKPQAGITFLLIDMKSPGVSVIPIISIDGQHGFNRVVLDHVRVPVENRIGLEGQGWTYAKGLLTHERTGQAYVSLSLTLLALLREQAAVTETAAGPLIDQPGFSGRLALVELELKALEFTELRTLAQVGAGEAPGAQSSVLKLKGTEIVQRITELLVECAGAYAAVWIPELLDPSAPFSAIAQTWMHTETTRYFQARGAAIAGGSDEIQHNIIAKQVLKI